ncbi:MAG: hypothetical protein ACKVS5_12700 [Parvularculaceae bacterium]
MAVFDDFPGGFRNAVILIGFAAIFIGLFVRRSHAANRGLGMGAIVTGASMIALSIAGRIWGWW